MLNHPAKVKASPWAAEEKPWSEYPYNSDKIHQSVELHCIYRTAKLLGKGNYANLGTHLGSTAACMAYGIKDVGGKVWAIDLFNHRDDAYQLASKAMKQCGLDHLVRFGFGYTHDWAYALRNTRFRMILIDADHHYETTKLDFELWSPLLDPDGIIMFHDVDMNTVDRVISELGPEWELVDHVYRLKTFKRKGR